LEHPKGVKGDGSDPCAEGEGRFLSR
jgi:hypothetical protein